MSGSGPIYEYQRELTAKLEQVMRERDEARAALRSVAEAQREACEKYAFCQACANAVGSAALVTEGDK